VVSDAARRAASEPPAALAVPSSEDGDEGVQQRDQGGTAAAEPWYRSDDPRRVELRDASVMRALAHPARIAIVDHLFAGHAGTATELAEVCGLSPSATSYHLRALAKAGLIEEAPNRGDGRERVWRSSFQGLDVSSGPSASPAERAAEHELTSAYVDVDHARVHEYLARRSAESQEWYDAAGFISMRLIVTPPELDELNRKIEALFEAYRLHRRSSGEVPADARKVYMTYRAFPYD
jgi:DNA-binding transcriptional ArsR family regulator